MIAVDTNVLVRYVTNDDPVQARAAMEILGGDRAVLISHTVLLEFEWVLRGVYGLSREVVQRAMLQVLGLPNVIVRQAERVDEALSLHREGMDFADALHLVLAEGAPLYTFDERLVRKGGKRAVLVPISL